MTQDLGTRDKFLSNTKGLLAKLSRKMDALQTQREMLIRDFVILFGDTDEGISIVDGETERPPLFKLVVDGRYIDCSISKVRLGKDYGVELLVDTVDGKPENKWWSEKTLGDAFPWNFFDYVK